MLIIEQKIEGKGNYPEKPFEVRKEKEKISSILAKFPHL